MNPKLREALWERSGGLCERMVDIQVPFYPPGDCARGEIAISHTRCGAPANDFHHIRAKGMGGTKRIYKQEDYLVLCRKHHDELLGKHSL